MDWENKDRDEGSDVGVGGVGRGFSDGVGVEEVIFRLKKRGDEVLISNPTPIFHPLGIKHISC